MGGGRAIMGGCGAPGEVNLTYTLGAEREQKGEGGLRGATTATKAARV